MRSVPAIVTAALVIAACGKTAPITSDHVAGAPSAQTKLQWGPAPAVFAPGAQLAVVSGDPSQAGVPFVVRLRFPNGYLIAPHFHPTDETVTVIEGAFRVGMGARVDVPSMQTLGRGQGGTLPAGHVHYAQAQGPTVVQVSAIGPFAITYVDANGQPKAGR